jgi:hypothetical protein
LKKPPKVLVKTWFDMMMQKESEEIRKIGKRNLLNSFGSNEAVMQALVDYNIVKKPKSEKA